jgi:PAS domain S-box-containing protein
MPDSDAPPPQDPERPGDPAGESEALVRAGRPDVGVQALFNSVPATVWMTDSRLALIFIEGLLLRRLKITPDRLLGRTLADLLLDGREDHPLIQGHLAALSGHENAVRIEWGGDIYSARLAPLHDGTGAIVGVVGVQQQIGWLPDDEGTLREADVRLRRAVDANMVGIAFGNEEGQITDANEAFLELAGYTREDLTADGISWPVLVPVERHQRHLDAIEEVRQTGRCTPFETELIRKDGRRVQVIVGGARLSARRREGVAFVLDISASKRVSRHLGAELASADALLDATAPDAAVAAVLAVLCTDLAWQGAMLWRQAPGEPSRLTARWGVTRVADAVLEEMARRAVAEHEVMWSAVSRTLAMPISTETARGGALLLVSHPDRTPDAETIATSRAIGLRLARFLDHL